MALLETYQQEAKLAEKTATEYKTAVVDAVFDDGVTLIFPDSSEPSKKHYKCNSSVGFSAGDRVHIAKENGTVIVEYKLNGAGGSDAISIEEIHELLAVPSNV